MSSKILLVDDDPNVLAGYQRQLRKNFQFEVAQNGQEGLAAILQSGPFAVVVSDMRMPGMDGIQFLSEVRKLAPDTVRMMLTGNADLDTCIDAVNEGSIFRFMTKPCAPEAMAKALQAGLHQHELVMAERELLQGTLRGCLRTLTDILSLMNPAAFSRGSRIRRYVRHMAAQLNVAHFWEYETAATLSQIGLIALPREVLERMNAGRALSLEHRSVVAHHPHFGCQLLAEIPRLELVAEIVGKQATQVKRRFVPYPNMPMEEVVEFGAQLLRVALDLDRFLLEGRTFVDALTQLQAQYGADHPLVESLMSFEAGKKDHVMMQVTAKELSTGMVSAEDVLSTGGHVLLSKGQPITDPIRLHLQSCAQVGGLQEPFSVEVFAEGN